ncbi:MAG: exo-alpha-sialidase, partial [Alistipes sp.]|nr:exo-alpha-sialidase [Alistipes sp.]
MKRITLLLTLMFAGFTALAQQRYDIFPTKSYDVVPYRIPAIAALKDGSVVCVADYRFSRQDIGVVKDGRIDLHLRRSEDGGKTWGEIYTLVEGKGAESPDFMNVAFGDPCIVADRESNRVMVMSCAGNVAYVKGQRDYHQGIARFYSDDGGKSWSKPTDI